MQKVFVGECISFAVVLGLLCLASTVVGRCEDFLSCVGVRQYISIRYFICFMMGYFYQRYMQGIIFNKWILFAALLLFPLAVKHFVFGKSPLYLQLAISVCASIIIFNLSKIIERTACLHCNKALDWLVMIGKKSLVIYLTHFAVITVIPADVVVTDHVKAIPLFLFCGLVSVPIAMLCVKWGELIATCPVIDFLMYGHKNTKR